MYLTLVLLIHPCKVTLSLSAIYAMSSPAKLLRKPLLASSSTLILVTGATGHIALNIIREALNLGYHVRGSARSSEKCAMTVAEQRNHLNYSTFVVSDFLVSSEEIDAAVRGVDSIIHVASDTSLSEDAALVVNGVVAAMRNILRAAAREPSIKRFTLTSSSTAVTSPKPGVEGIFLTTDKWNDEAVEAAIAGRTIEPNPYSYIVYGVSSGREGALEFYKGRETVVCC